LFLFCTTGNYPKLNFRIAVFMPVPGEAPQLNPAGCVVVWVVVGGKDRIKDKYGSLETWKCGSMERGAMAIDL
jgi:hypothetical protein